MQIKHNYSCKLTECGKVNEYEELHEDNVSGNQ